MKLHQSSGESYHTDVVSRTSLYSHHVALLEVEVVDIMIISLAGIFELHLHEVGALGIARYVGKPVVGIQLAVLATSGFTTKSTVTTMPHSEFHIFVIHAAFFKLRINN